MALKTFVKISNVTNLSDARYCAGMGVDLIGFSIDPQSENYISAEKAIEIAEWLSGVEFVAEFSGEDSDDLKETVAKFPVSFLEYTRPELTNVVNTLGFSSIFKISLPHDLQDRNFHDAVLFCGQQVDYVLIDDIRDFNDEKVVGELKKYCEQFPVILGGDFTSENILQLLDEIPAKGIALKGSEEIKPGYKDYDELADILEVLEVDDLN